MTNVLPRSLRRCPLELRWRGDPVFLHRVSGGDMTAARGRLRAQIERFLSPGLGYCYRCQRPWKVPAQRRTGPRSYQQLSRNRFFGLIGVESHATPYKDGSGCFPLCQGCWSELTPEQRFPYYQKLVHNWIWQLPEYQEKYEADAKLIYKAVLDGR